LIALGIGKRDLSHQTEQYMNFLAELCDNLIEKKDVNIIFFPMHTSIYEADSGFSKQVQEFMRYKSRVRIVDRDTLSPQDFHNVIGSCKTFIGFRLHSFILATIAKVPSMVFYYVDKGRIFADQIGMSEYAKPIDFVLRDNAVQQSEALIGSLMHNNEIIVNRLSGRVKVIRDRLISDFNSKFF
jgi:polysaccharide pyruvyl transferase WcaK-like protein